MGSRQGFGMFLCMTIPRVFHAFVAIVFGLNAVVVGGVAIWLDPIDGSYASSVVLAILGVFTGFIAVKAWKRSARGLN
jgi:hypothetical protein